MAVVTDIVKSYHDSLIFNSEKSRLELGEIEVSFHCDKFNTRILKNFEDVLGYEKGSELLEKAAARTTYDQLKKFLNSENIKETFEALNAEDKVATILEMFKVPAYGAIKIASLSPEKSVFTSKSSYLAEGWLENKEKWNWSNRENAACHDIRGHLIAVLSLVFDRPIESYKVQETKCRAKGDEICEFIAEVK